jgi:hypothetical protein
MTIIRCDRCRKELGEETYGARKYTEITTVTCKLHLCMDCKDDFVTFMHKHDKSYEEIEKEIRDNKKQWNKKDIL